MFYSYFSKPSVHLHFCGGIFQLLIAQLHTHTDLQHITLMICRLLQDVILVLHEWAIGGMLARVWGGSRERLKVNLGAQQPISLFTHSRKTPFYIALF